MVPFVIIIVPRMDFAHAVLELKVYVFGGTSDGFSHNALSTCEVYDSKMNNWTSIASMPTKRCHAVAVTIDHDTIIVMGGFVTTVYSKKYEVVDTIEEYTPSTNQWRTLPWRLPNRRADFGVAYDHRTNQLMIVGGSSPIEPLPTHTRAVYTRRQPFQSNEWIKCPLEWERHSFGYCS
jgi:N-acetylneuraminic acid mutarotase